MVYTKDDCRTVAMELYCATAGLDCSTPADCSATLT
jgi:hypothetical protein